MTTAEYGEIVKLLNGCWPGKFGETALGVMWDRLFSRVPLEDAVEGIKSRVTVQAPTEIADILRAVNEVTNTKARRKLETRRVCSTCEGTGWAQALDNGDKSFAFRCTCGIAHSRGLSERIPLWDPKFVKQGFRPFGSAKPTPI